MNIKIKTSQQVTDIDLKRRQFLKTGLLGGLLLSTAHLGACSSKTLIAPLNTNQYSPYLFLTREDAIMLSALLPAMLAQNWPASPVAQRQAEADTLQRIDTFLLRVGAFNQHEIRKLFDLLQVRLARGLTSGIWRSWENTDRQQIEAFLQSWKHSGISLFNSGYNGLSDIICFAWYSNPQNTLAFGYAGVPDHVAQNLPQFHAHSLKSHIPTGTAS